MKTTMKIFAAIMIMFGFTVTTFGQTDISAKATVIQSLVVTGESNLQFGNVLQGVEKAVDAGGNVVLGTAGGLSESAGNYLVKKSYNSLVALSFELPTYLKATSDNTKHLAIEYAMGGTTLCAIDAYAFTPTLAPQQITSALFNTAFTGNEFNVYIGGRVIPTTDQYGDSYEGTVTMTAVYN